MTDPQESPVSGTNGDPSGFSVSDLAGSYAFRFDGFTMTNNILYSLRGLGQFELDQNGKLSGKHRSSITQLQGQDAALQTSVYTLKGQIKPDSNGMVADINFTNAGGFGANVDGKFFVLVATNPHRLWFISSGATLPDSKNAPAVETVSIEAIRMVTP